MVFVEKKDLDADAISSGILEIAEHALEDFDAMRTREGIPLEMLTTEQRRYLLDASQKMAERGLLTISDTHVSLTHSGIFVSNSVMAELIKA